MADPKNWETPEPLAPMADSEYESSDLGFNRRIGLGLIISIGANVLLLQGAGVMKDKMNETPPAETVIHMTLTTPTPAPLATPTPTPSPTPKKAEATPTPPPHEKQPAPTPQPKPTPEPVVKPKPTPKPEPAKPTPTPIEKPIEKPVPTPKPTVEPEKTPTPVMKTQQDKPAIETTPTREVSLKSNNKPAMGNPSAGAKVMSATTPRENTPAAATSFTVDANNVAPAPHVADLPHKSFSSEVSAAISNATSAKVQQNNTPDVDTTVTDHTTSQARTVAGKTMINSGRNAVITSRDASANANFAMSSSGNVAPGQAMAYQGLSGRSSVAAMSGSAPTVLAADGTQNVSVSAPGMHAGAGPPGVFRPGKMMSSTVGVAPGDRTRGAAGGGTVNGAIGQGLNAGGNVREALGAATHGTATAQYSPGAAYNTNLQGGSGPTASISAGSGTGTGVHMLGSGRKGAMRGSANGGSSITSGTGGGGGAGAVGLSDGVVGGTGNGPGFKTGARTGGSATGIGSGSNIGGTKDGGGGVVVAGGGDPPKKAATLKSGGDSTRQKEDNGYGSAVNADFTTPSSNSITTPESLRSKPYDVTVTVRVVLQANGRVSVEITKGSGYDALDAQVKAVCERIKFKPAMQDGKAVDDTERFNFHLTNGG